MPQFQEEEEEKKQENPEVAQEDMQPQEVIDLFQSYKLQRDFELMKFDKINEKKQANKTLEGYLEHLVIGTDEKFLDRLAQMNKNYAAKTETQQEVQDQFPSLLKV